MFNSSQSNVDDENDDNNDDNDGNENNGDPENAVDQSFVVEEIEMNNDDDLKVIQQGFNDALLDCDGII
jgi:hypothetical protein